MTPTDLPISGPRPRAPGQRSPANGSPISGLQHDRAGADTPTPPPAELDALTLAIGASRERLRHGEPPLADELTAWTASLSGGSSANPAAPARAWLSLLAELSALVDELGAARRQLHGALAVLVRQDGMRRAYRHSAKLEPAR